MTNGYINNIREIRKESKMTLSDLSQKVGISIAYLSDIERGNRPGGKSTLSKIADALGVQVADLQKVG